MHVLGLKGCTCWVERMHVLGLKGCTCWGSKDARVGVVGMHMLGLKGYVSVCVGGGGLMVQKWERRGNRVRMWRHDC